MDVQRNLTNDTVTLTLTSAEVLAASHAGGDKTAAQVIAMLAMYVESDLPVYDLTRCEIQGAGIFTSEQGLPHRIVLW